MAGTVASVEFRVLGPLEVAVDGQVVAIGSLQQRVILAALILARDAVVPADQLIDILWDDDPPPTADSTLRGLVWRLRKRLEVVDIDGQADGYRLRAGIDSTDFRRFDALAMQGRQAAERNETESAATAFDEALNLWRGPALGELATWPFAQAEATRLNEARLDTVEQLADAELALGRTSSALIRLESLVHQAPLREQAVGQLMVALYRTGRQADALAAYQSLRRNLADELGLEPTPALRDLEGAILRQSEELLASSLAPTPNEPDRHSVVLGDTVAFLFTDIEASTRAWEGDAAGMGSDLELHDAILTDICVAWDGQVFAHTGDGLCVAFATAAAAIGAAVDGQRALETAGWQGDLPLRVRMAVHAGAAQRRGDNWFGPTLNRAARLLAVAAGGQIICSETAAGLARDLLPDEVGLVDCGEIDLPDLSRPERVYQVAHPDLRVLTAPLRSPTRTSPHHNLPSPLTVFVGRARELADIQHEVAASRLVTLVGPGGAGKTRLALEVAGRMRDFPDGVRLVELAHVSDGSIVPQTIAAGVGLLVGELAQSPQGIKAALAERLRSRRMLIVLDNCEQVIDDAATNAHALLSSCPDLRILATSREALAVSGEVVFSVPPLTTADAVALFCARAHNADRHFSLSDANSEAVQRICQRLDGLPLALEIAAARTRVLGTKELADRLDDRFVALGEGSRAAPARHQTLRAAIDWSHDLLSPAEQAVLHRLSVFPGSFDLEAVQAVIGTDAAPPFTRLVDKSLVTVTASSAGTRYQLSESVRAYAAEQLAASGHATEVQRAHRDAFLAMATLWSAQEEDWQLSSDVLRTVDSDYASFTAALEWSWANGDHDAAVRLSAMLVPYWYWTGHPEACDWMERAAGVPVSSPAMVRPAVLARSGLAWLLRNFGRAELDRVEAIIGEAINIADNAADPSSQAFARFVAADHFMITGQRSRSEEYLRQAHERFRALGSAYEMACDRLWIWLALSDGDFEAAARSLDEQLERSRATPDSLHVPHSLAAAAVARACLGDHSAVTLGDEAVASARLFTVPQILVMALARAAEAAVILEQNTDARTYVIDLIETLRRLGARRWVGEALELAAIVFGDEQPDTAALALGAAERVRAALGEPSGPAFLLGETLATASERVRERLGPEGFAQQKARGANLPVDEALALVAGRLGGSG